jgi:hypothetical protein
MELEWSQWSGRDGEYLRCSGGDGVSRNPDVILINIKLINNNFNLQILFISISQILKYLVRVFFKTKLIMVKLCYFLKFRNLMRGIPLWHE